MKKESTNVVYVIFIVICHLFFRFSLINYKHFSAKTEFIYVYVVFNVMPGTGRIIFRTMISPLRIQYLVELARVHYCRAAGMYRDMGTGPLQYLWKKQSFYYVKYGSSVIQMRNEGLCTKSVRAI